MKFDRKYALSQIRIACGETRRNLGMTIADVSSSLIRMGDSSFSPRDIGRIENGSADLVEEGVFRRVLLVLGLEEEDFNRLTSLHRIARTKAVVYRWRDLPRRMHKDRRESLRQAVRR